MDEGELASRSVAVITGTVQTVQAAADTDSGGVNSYITIEPESVIAGAVPSGQVVLRETGGRVPEREEFVYGAPEYTPGEKVLAFLSRNPDGSLHTTAMAMGKYRLDDSRAASLDVRRTFGVGVTLLRRTNRAATADISKLEDVIARIHAAPLEEEDGYSAPIHWKPSELERVDRSFTGAFSYFATPARWFEPDFGQPVVFNFDPTGDPKIGAEGSRSAIVQALAAWSSIDSARLNLAIGTEIASQPFAGCGGGNRIVFNDPNNEITDPTNCGGILAIGGYCASWETTTRNGTTFRRIAIGKVTLNNGWDKCAGWNGCNLAEVVTHEIGHAIGLGHSEEMVATMSPSAHFDGRCAEVETDDIEGANSLYGDPTAPTATASPSPTPTEHMIAVPSQTSTRPPTRTPTSTPPPTVEHTPTSTQQPTSTRTPTIERPATSTRTPTVARTKTPTRVRSATRTKTPTRTRTIRRTRTATRTRTVTRTRTFTRTPTPTRTPAEDVSGGVARPAQSTSNESWMADEIRRIFRLE